MSIKGFKVGNDTDKYDYPSLDNIPDGLVQDPNYHRADTALYIEKKLGE